MFARRNCQRSLSKDHTDDDQGTCCLPYGPLEIHQFLSRHVGQMSAGPFLRTCLLEKLMRRGHLLCISTRPIRQYSVIIPQGLVFPTARPWLSSACTPYCVQVVRCLPERCCTVPQPVEEPTALQQSSWLRWPYLQRFRSEPKSWRNAVGLLANG